MFFPLTAVFKIFFHAVKTAVHEVRNRFLRCRNNQSEHAENIHANQQNHAPDNADKRIENIVEQHFPEPTAGTARARHIRMRHARRRIETDQVFRENFEQGRTGAKRQKHQQRFPRERNIRTETRRVIREQKQKYREHERRQPEHIKRDHGNRRAEFAHRVRQIRFRRYRQIL